MAPVATVSVSAPGGSAKTYTVVFTEPDALTAEASVLTRCVAGKTQVVVSVREHQRRALTVGVATPYGSKTVTGIAPDKRVSTAFSTRQPTIPAGSASVTITGSVDGQTVTHELTVPIAAGGCLL